MSFIFVYSLFAVATAICAVYEILYPVMNLRLSEGHEIKGMYMMYITFFVITIIVAPLVFFSCIIPSMGDRFKMSLYTGLFNKD